MVHRKQTIATANRFTTTPYLTVNAASLTIRLRREACDANSGVAFVADIEADEQGGDLLDNARIFQFAAVDGADAGNFCGEIAGELSGVGIVATDNDVAVERIVSVEQFGGDVVKCGDHAHTFGDKFGGLLRRGTLPDAESARGASADTRGERHGGVDQNAACGNGRVELLEQRCLAFEGNSEHQQIGGGARGGIFHAGDVGLSAGSFFEVCGDLVGALRVARTDDDGLSGPRPAQSEAGAGGAGAAEDGNGSGRSDGHAAFRKQSEKSLFARKKTGCCGHCENT